MKLSIVILAHNEAERLARLLPRLPFADEIIVIDDTSTDETVAVAKKFGAKVYEHQLRGDYAKARNFGLDKAGHDWVLYLDADETPGQDLIAEIKEVLANPTKDGYFIKRRDIFLGKRLNHGETGNMSLLRLGKKSAGKWVRPVHEVWQIKNTGELSSPLLHQSHTTIRGFINKIKGYAKLDADYRQQAGVPLSVVEMLSYPLLKFFYTLFWQRGFLDGWRGILMSLGMSLHSFLVRWYRLKYVDWGSSGLKYLILAVILAIPLGQITRVQLTDTIAVYLFEVLMALAIGWWLIKTITTKKQLKLTLVSRWLVIFSGVLMLSLVVNWPNLKETFLSPLLYLARWLLYVGFYVAGEQAMWRGWVKLPIKRLLVWIGVATAILGLIQYVVWPDTRFLYFLGWDDHYFRLIGAYLDPAFTGLLLVLTLVMLEFRKGVMGKIMYGLCLTALALTFSRSSYLVYGVMIGLLALRKKEFLTFVTKAIIFGLVIFLLPKPGGEGVNLARTYSVESRVESVAGGYNLVRENLFLGVGFNAYREATRTVSRGLPVHPSGPDNSFMLVLVTSGLVGLSVFVGMWLFWLKTAWKDVAVFTSLVVIGLHAFTNNSFFYPFVLLWMFLNWWQFISSRKV